MGAPADAWAVSGRTPGLPTPRGTAVEASGSRPPPEDEACGASATVGVKDSCEKKKKKTVVDQLWRFHVCLGKWIPSFRYREAHKGNRGTQWVFGSRGFIAICARGLLNRCGSLNAGKNRQNKTQK